MQAKMVPDGFESVPAADVDCCNELSSIGVQAEVLGQRLRDRCPRAHLRKRCGGTERREIRV